MTWLTNVPRGDLLPVDEKPRFQGNWSYIQTEMRDDHSWDEDADRDGHHKKMELPNLTDAIGAGNVDANGDPTALSTSMTGYHYVRPKTAAEAPGGQFTEPFYMMNDGSRNQFLQLGVRAMVNFTGSGANGAQTVNYSHNVSGVSRTSAGIYVVTFAVQMPTANYVPLIGAIRDNAAGAPMLAGVLPETSFGTNMTTTTLTLRFSRGSSSTNEDPIRGWVTVLGG